VYPLTHIVLIFSYLFLLNDKARPAEYNIAPAVKDRAELERNSIKVQERRGPTAAPKSNSVAMEASYLPA